MASTQTKALSIQNPNSNIQNGIRFAVVVWVLSRAIVFLAMLAIAPLLPAPPDGIKAEFGLEVFYAWDSEHYQDIATISYGTIDTKASPIVAFFPLFPLLVRGLMAIGLPYEVAGMSVNNLAFLGALVILYLWVEERQGIQAARWATTALAFCPFSLFGTVIYTEGVFLFLSAAALRSFDRKRYVWASLFGALASAARVPGVTLVPTFLLAAWQEKRSRMAYVAALASGIGILCYSVYCWIWFGNPFAFAIAQKAWQPEQAFWGQTWVRSLVEITLGPANWNNANVTIIDPWHPLAFIAVVGIGYWLLRSRSRLGLVKTGYCLSVLMVLFWLLAGNPLINMTMVLGGIVLLWKFRDRIGCVAANYGFFSLLLILSPGRTLSVERHVYAIISVAIAFGVLLARYPRWGYVAISFFGLLLFLYSIRFAQHLWIA